MQNRRRRLFDSKLAVQVQLKVLYVEVHIWKNQQPPTVFLYDAKNHKYWTAVRHYARYRSTINNKLPFFQKVLVFSDGKQSIEPCPIV